MRLTVTARAKESRSTLRSASRSTCRAGRKRSQISKINTNRKKLAISKSCGLAAIIVPSISVPGSRVISCALYDQNPKSFSSPRMRQRKKCTIHTSRRQLNTSPSSRREKRGRHSRGACSGSTFGAVLLPRGAPPPNLRDVGGRQTNGAECRLGEPDFVRGQLHAAGAQHRAIAQIDLISARVRRRIVKSHGQDLRLNLVGAL